MKDNPLHLMYVILLVGVVLFYVGCSGGGSSANGPAEYRFGSDGIVLQMHPGNSYTFYEGDDVSILVEMFNKGTSDAYGEIYLSGFDPNFMNMYVYPSPIIDMRGKDQFDPNGEFGEQLTIAASHVRLPNNRQRFTQSVQITACYDYVTYATAEVCIDPDPYNRRVDDKVCQSGAQSPGGQGHPIVINSVDVAPNRNDIRFTIRFSNSGNGDVFDLRVPYAKCAVGLDYDEVDVAYVQSVRLSGRPLSCEPLNPVRMRSGTGTIVCECINCIDQYTAAYKSLLEMELAYKYRTSITRDIEIVSDR